MPGGHFFSISLEGIAWIEAELEFLWNAARPLPEAVCRDVRRRGHREEVDLPAIDNVETLAPAALIESPLYREGMSLRPWQQGFVDECLRHYNDHDQLRMLLADEVRIGIVSTGLMMQPSQEKERLAALTFQLVILDEAHKARMRQGVGPKGGGTRCWPSCSASPTALSICCWARRRRSRRGARTCGT